MGTTYYKVLVSSWIFFLVAFLDTLSHCRVEGLQVLDKSKFPPKPRGTIKTIEDPEVGELIDCIDIYKQPAFDDPLMKDIQLKPSPHVIRVFNQTNGRPPMKLFQSWHKYGKCPKGTVPISRTWNNITFPRKSPNDDRNEHEYAAAISRTSKFFGASGAFSLWNPKVQRGTTEFSLSQMWLVTRNGPASNSLEVGWMVFPRDYGDTETHFFTFWTNDNYGKTQCYNYKCNGFVHNNNEIKLGSIITPTSVYGGDQHELFLAITRDKETGNWWLQYQNTEVGYFRKGVFTNLNNGAEEVQFGGEVINERRGNQHTTTEMGSGHFPNEGYGKAAYVRLITLVDGSYGVFPFETLSPFVTNSACYSLRFGRRGTDWKTHFFFGGSSGRSRECL